MKKATVRWLVVLCITALFAACTQPPEVIPGYEGTRLNPDFLSDVDDVKALMNAMVMGDQAGMDMYMHEKFFVNGPAKDDYYTRQEFIDRALSFAEDFDQAKASGEIFFSLICDAFEGRPELIGEWGYTCRRIITPISCQFRNLAVSFQTYFHGIWQEGRVEQGAGVT